ncbi:amidase [Vogesella sp. LIG4]|uniref:amidase n=1 Tax=Vogesella sp. LIG4 TaxID=1192162 RepID=UPI0008200C97|nr:amidase [Vogesella sp. LIG4]SCK29784.1 aspartyl-tRNA(Asn)/glutamyl-tRNA(Gln) amidotransferase subunit A [Vogesella sp. LIG4]
MNQTLCYMSATEALRRFRNGSLSPVTLMQAVLEAAHKQQVNVNATTAIRADEAIARAREAEQRYRDGTARPLEGIPVVVKEETAVAGWPNTVGSLVLDDYVPDENHPMIDKLLDAGAILHAQATNPEFCCLGQTWSRRWGVTRNPWNLRYTCGGSSGGSAAAVAAGVAPLATGSDMGGSTRLPAAFQGLYGYKPPFGRLASGPGEELFAFAAEGPLARTFEDMVLMQNIIAGPHPASYNGMPYQPLPDRYDDLSGWKIAYHPSLGSPAVCPDVQHNLEQALEGLRGRGAVVEKVDIEWDLLALSKVLMEGIFGIYFDEYLRELPDSAYDKLTSYMQHLWRDYRGKSNSVMKSAELASSLHREMQQKVWGQGYRAFICPTTFTTEIEADMDPTQQPQLQVNGVALDSYLGWAATPPFNLLGRYPALSVPTGRAHSGVPTGMQIIAPSYQDEVAFQVAYNHSQAARHGLYRQVFPEFA